MLLYTMDVAANCTAAAGSAARIGAARWQLQPVLQSRAFKAQ
jgi:hypothetical protein